MPATCVVPILKLLSTILLLSSTAPRATAFPLPGILVERKGASGGHGSGASSSAHTTIAASSASSASFSHEQWKIVFIVIGALCGAFLLFLAWFLIGLPWWRTRMSRTRERKEKKERLRMLKLRAAQRGNGDEEKSEEAQRPGHGEEEVGKDRLLAGGFAGLSFCRVEVGENAGKNFEWIALPPKAFHTRT